MVRMVLLACVVVLAVCSGRPSPASRKSLRSVDCRRLVFHPFCRGVAAKRSMPSPLEGLAEQYTMDELDPAPDPPPLQGLQGLLVGVLDRMAVQRLFDEQGDSGEHGERQASEAEWNSDQGKDYGRFEWHPARKRVKEQELSYDY